MTETSVSRRPLLRAVHPGRGTTQPTPCVATISAA
jgi:hypothetical protein